MRVLSNSVKLERRREISLESCSSSLLLTLLLRLLLVAVVLAEVLLRPDSTCSNNELRCCDCCCCLEVEEWEWESPPDMESRCANLDDVLI